MKTTDFERRIIKLEAKVLAITWAVAGGLGLFILTAVLLLKGGVEVGKHLRLLHHYLPGFEVTWTGACIGLLYGSMIGGAAGYLCALIYNGLAFRGKRPPPSRSR